MYFWYFGSDVINQIKLTMLLMGMVLFSTECNLIVGESGHLKGISLRSNKKKRNNLSLSSTRLATRLHF